MPTKSETTISVILSAAEELYLAKNYADVTMDQIARCGGVTKGALYHHFPGKEDLYLRMMHTALARKRTLFSDALASGRGCRERLGRLTQAFFDLPKDQIGLMRLVRRDANVFAPAARAKLVRSYQASLPSLVEDVIRDGIQDGELAPADPRLLAWHFIATVEVTLGRHADGVFKNSGAKLNYVLNLFFRGAAATDRAHRKENAAAGRGNAAASRHSGASHSGSGRSSAASAHHAGLSRSRTAAGRRSSENRSGAARRTQQGAIS